MAAEVRERIMALLAQEPQTASILRQLEFLERDLARLEAPAPEEGRYQDDIAGIFICGIFTFLAVGSGACFTTASAISGKHSAQVVADWSTAGYAAATAVAITPLTLTNIVKVVLGRAVRIRMDRRKRFLFINFTLLLAILISCMFLRFSK